MLAERHLTRKVSARDLVDGRLDTCLWTESGGSEISTVLPRSSLFNAIVKYLVDSFLVLDRVSVLALL